VAALSTVAFAAFGVSAAFAGEVTGSGHYIAGSDSASLNGNSDCAYSGLNDNYVFGTAAPGTPTLTASPGRRTGVSSTKQPARSSRRSDQTQASAANPTRSTGE